MGRSIQTALPLNTSDNADSGDAFCFLAFNQGTGELLAHGHRAVFALARADLRAPHKAIEILNAGVAGPSLWQKQTPLAMARLVLDMLSEPLKSLAEPRPKYLN